MRLDLRRLTAYLMHVRRKLAGRTAYLDDEACSCGGQSHGIPAGEAHLEKGTEEPSRHQQENGAFVVSTPLSPSQGEAEVMRVPALVCGEIGLVRSLGEAGIPVYVGSYYHDNVALYSRYCRRRILFSHYRKPSFVTELVSLGRSLNQKLPLLSDDDRVVLTVSRNREELSQFFYFNLPDKEIVEDILDKERYASLAQRLKLPVPWTVMPDGHETLERLAKEISYPCVLKPLRKDDWWHPDFIKIVGPYRKAIQCNNREELFDYFDRVRKVRKEVLVQEFVPGDDTTLCSINMYFNARCELQTYFIGKKHRVYPIHAGVGCLVETVEDDEIKQVALESAEKLKMMGFLNVQFKRDGCTGQLKILEMHTRNSLWSHLSTASGLNIAAIGYYDMLGLEYPFPKKYRCGGSWIDLNKDFQAFLDYRKSREWTFWRWLKSLRGKKVFHVHSLRDPFPMIADIWFMIKRRLGGSVVRRGAPQYREQAIEKT